MKELLINGLSKSYGDFTVLKNIHLHYRSGMLHGIIGNNGAGKTTFFNCIAGNIGYKGMIEKKGIESIGILSATPYMFPRITGYEFIRFCLSAKNRKEDSDKLNKLNQLFDLPLNKYGEDYSTGMLKKLHLLALLLQNNDLLLLDEPFNGLDIISASYLSELLKELRNTGSLILISSHDIAQLLKITDTITVVGHQTAVLKSESLHDIERKIQEEAADKVRSVFINPSDR